MTFSCPVSAGSFSSRLPLFQLLYSFLDGDGLSYLQTLRLAAVMVSFARYNQVPNLFFGPATSVGFSG